MFHDSGYGPGRHVRADVAGRQRFVIVEIHGDKCGVALASGDRSSAVRSSVRPSRELSATRPRSHSNGHRLTEYASHFGCPRARVREIHLERCARQTQVEWRRRSAIFSAGRREIAPARDDGPRGRSAAAAARRRGRHPDLLRNLFRRSRLIFAARVRGSIPG